MLRRRYCANLNRRLVAGNSTVVRVPCHSVRVSDNAFILCVSGSMYSSTSLVVRTQEGRGDRGTPVI